jgi:sodium/bile acid cotransporter 7
MTAAESGVRRVGAARWKFDWFLPGMGVAVALACAFPGPGAHGGWMHPEIVTKAGVALIFFLHGVALSFGALRAGAFQWRLHAVVQVATFALFPVLGLAMLAVFGRWITAPLRTGSFYLCALPSTVSSSVAMTAAARGNVPAAVFNATLSSLLGVVLTPLLMGWYLGVSGEGAALGDVIADLIKWLVLPLVVGQVARIRLAGWAARNKPRINVVDRLTILLLVYTSFCDSVAMGVWQGHGLDAFAALGASAVLFFAVMFLVGRTCDRLGFSTADRIAAIFCGSKKTLASGVPMAQLMFGETPDLGLILLPIMIYHPLQLIICGALAGRWGKRSDGGPVTTQAVVERLTPLDED